MRIFKTCGQLLLTVFFLSIFPACFSQRNSDSLYFVNMRSRKIVLPEKLQNSSYSLPFHSIQIWDARPDTTCIGFLKHGSSNPNKLYFEKGFANSFNEFVANNYSLSKDSNNLLILVKEFRISEYVMKGNGKDVNVYHWKSGTVISAELFLNDRNTYRALYKIDSILVAVSEEETVAELVEESFTTILKKSQDKSLSEMHIGKTIFSYNDIHKHVEDFSNIPIFNDLVLKKGVYKTFNEFKLNNPSITDCEVHKGKLSDELFINENNQSYPLQDFWGYCNGENLFIYSAKNLFQLFRSGNTFNIKGIKSFKRREVIIKDTPTEVLGNLILTGRQSGNYLNDDINKPDITPFQLNMQTGELY